MAGITYRFVRGIRAQTDVQYRLAEAGPAERWANLHLSQSQLDSACGLHSLCMALMLLTGVRRSQVEGLTRATRGPFHALWKLAREHVFSGIDSEDLVAYLQPFAQDVASEVVSTASPRRIGQAVEAAVTAGAVPVLRFDSRSWSHFCVVVGFECQGRSMPTALCVLDPSHPSPWLTPFNGRLDLSGAGGKSVRVSKGHPLPYRLIGGEGCAVRLRGLVIVRRTRPPP